MTDRFTPEEVREMLMEWAVVVVKDQEMLILLDLFRQLCRDYLSMAEEISSSDSPQKS